MMLRNTRSRAFGPIDANQDIENSMHGQQSLKNKVKTNDNALAPIKQATKIKSRRALGDITNQSKNKDKTTLGLKKVSLVAETVPEDDDVEFVHGKGMTGKFDGGLDSNIVLKVCKQPLTFPEVKESKVQFENMEDEGDWLDLDEEDLDLDMDFDL